MAKEIKQINKNVMDKIHKHEIKMKPKYYFIIGSIMTAVGLVSAVVLTILSSSIILFLFKAKGPGASFRLSMMIDNFPVWLFVLVAIGLFGGMWALKKYDFSYKLSYKKIIFIFFAVVALSVLAIDALGLTKLFIQRGPMHLQLNRYLEEQSTEKFPRKGMIENNQKINNLRNFE